MQPLAKASIAHCTACAKQVARVCPSPCPLTLTADCWTAPAAGLRHLTETQVFEWSLNLVMLKLGCAIPNSMLTERQVHLGMQGCAASYRNATWYKQTFNGSCSTWESQGPDIECCPRSTSVRGLGVRQGRWLCTSCWRCCSICCSSCCLAWMASWALLASASAATLSSASSFSTCASLTLCHLLCLLWTVCNSNS